eukprot:TCONS_00062934-protein
MSSLTKNNTMYLSSGSDALMHNNHHKSTLNYKQKHRRNILTTTRTTTLRGEDMAKVNEHSPQGYHHHNHQHQYYQHHFLNQHLLTSPPPTTSLTTNKTNNKMTVFDERREIDQVLDCVKKDGCRYYKIRWKDTWEREEYLTPFSRTINRFWEDVQASRKLDDEKEQSLFNKIPDNVKEHDELKQTQQIERSESPIQDRPPSPVYRNGAEYSPQASDLSDHSPYNTSLKSPSSDISDKTFQTGDYEEASTLEDSSPQAIPSGRRKGKPKKLVRDEQDEEENNTLEAGHSQSRTPELKAALSPALSHASAKDLLTVEIPENRASSTSPHQLTAGKKRNGSVEEYPVMIIRENSEDTMSRQNKTQIHKPDSLRLNEEPSRKRPRIPSPEYGHDFPITIPSTVAELVTRSEKYTSPVPSPEESPLYPRLPQEAFHPETYFSAYPTERLFKPVRGYHHNNNTPLMYHSQVITGRKRSPVPHYMYTDIHNPTALSATKPTSKLESSNLLLKVTDERPPKRPDTLLPPSTRQPYPGYPPATLQPQPTKPRSKENTSSKSKTPTKYLITADGEQRPQCPECFQTFKKRAALERHMMIHRGIKPFQCHFCNQRFRQKHHLQGHVMLHTGERPHSCALCNKRFRMRHHLLEHERISHKVFR